MSASSSRFACWRSHARHMPLQAVHKFHKRVKEHVELHRAFIALQTTYMAGMRSLYGQGKVASEIESAIAKISTATTTYVEWLMKNIHGQPLLAQFAH